jgi:hypothetical protein
MINKNVRFMSFCTTGANRIHQFLPNLQEKEDILINLCVGHDTFTMPQGPHVTDKSMDCIVLRPVPTQCN